MSFLQDLVGGAGCDASSSLNPISSAINSTVENAEAAQFASELQAQAPDEQPFVTEDEFDFNFDELGDAFMPQDIDWAGQFWNSHDRLDPSLRLYEFRDLNPFLTLDNPFETGMALFKDGRLEEAILALEAEVQLRPHSSDAWRWLGTAHAENDEDKKAILALQRSLEADPENLEALMDLGVSYTNELVRDKALNYLKTWLKRHSEYQQLVDEFDSQLGEAPLQHEHIADLYQRAAEIDPFDPDVYAVLGVLYNMSKDYEQAEKAFEAALELDPKNYSLWNKLGATQANSSKVTGSKKAVHAYRRALELKPNYVRAWVNMGISYANQGFYDIASKYYLRALSLNPNAEHVWSYLHLSLVCMERDDLASLTDDRDLEVFRQHFEF